MMNQIDSLKDIIKIYKSIQKYQNKLDDLSANLLLQELLRFQEYFPVTDSSLRFHTLAVILNDIILNKRQNCIEFGSGISTLVIANLLKRNKLPYKLFSVEDNIEWYNYMNSFVVTNDLTQHVVLMYAPLEKTELATGNNSWYSTKILDEKINTDLKFNLVIVDGPGAWKPEIQLSRYTAVPYLINKLAENFSIYLDDSNRKGEKKIIDLWQKKYKLKFSQINDTTSVSTKGNNLNTIL